MQNKLSKHALTHLQQQLPALNLLVLIGSRAIGTARTDSDWDFVCAFSEQDFFTRLQYTEQLRAGLAKLLKCPTANIDLIDFNSANLSMRVAIANDGQPLIITDYPRWYRFLSTTWQELEYWHWERDHAA